MSTELSLTNSNILRVALPIMVGGFIQFLVNFTNTAFVGQLGEIQLNSVGNAGLIYITLFVAGQGFGTAMQILIARRKGQEKYKQIGLIFDHSMILMAILAVSLILGIRLFSDYALQYLIRDHATMSGMQEFLKYRSWGFLFSILQVGIIGYYMGIAKTKILGYSTAITAVLNVFLDYSFIYGKFGFPEMGIAGAGLASTLAEALSLAFILVWQYFDSQTKEYGLYKFRKFKKSVAAKLFTLSYPLIAQRFISLFAWTAFFLMIEKTGSRELAISQIVRSLYFLAFIPIFGFGSATGTFVSHYMAKNDTASVLKAIKKIGFIGAIFTFVFVHGYLFYPRPIISLLTSQDYLIVETIPILRLIVSSMLIHAFVMVIFSAVSGVGDTRMSFIIEAGSIVIYLVYCYYVCIVNPQSLFVIWAAEFIYFGLLALFSLAYFKWSNWRNYTI